MARFRFMVIDEDGQRIGRFESGDPNWRAGDTFTLGEQLLRILETPATDNEQATYPAAPVAEAQGRTRF
jgi:hypothetical protein